MLKSLVPKGKGILLQIIKSEQVSLPLDVEDKEPHRLSQKLPPIRTHDYQIILKKDTSPIFTRPYK